MFLGFTIGYGMPRAQGLFLTGKAREAGRSRIALTPLFLGFIDLIPNRYVTAQHHHSAEHFMFRRPLVVGGVCDFIGKEKGQNSDCIQRSLF